MSLQKMSKLSVLLYSISLHLYANSGVHSVELGKLRITSEKSNLTEGTNSYTTGNMNTSTKLALSIKDTPQAVTVISSQELEDKNILSSQELYEQITGLTINREDEGFSAFARGFELDYFKIDGAPQYTFVSSRDLDLSIYDRVEIVKGANGLTTGSGNPAISINYVRKHANSKTLKGEIRVSTGSWNAYSSTVDISTPINKQGSIRARVIATHKKEDSFIDKYNKEKNLAYMVIDADITDNTYLSVGASYEKLNKNGVSWGGLPAFNSNGKKIDLDRSSYVTEDWTYWNIQTKTAFVTLEQFLTDQISLNINYNYSKTDTQSKLLWITGALNESDGSGMSARMYEDNMKRSDENLDVNMKIPFKIASLDQEFLIGGTYNKYSSLKNDVAYLNDWNGILIPNFYDYKIKELYAKDSEKLSRSLNHSTQKAIYFTQKLQLHDNVKVIFGSRLSKYSLITEDVRFKSRHFTNVFTPYFGLVLDVNKQHTLYASYTDIFQPQSQRDIDDNYLDPKVGKSYETGIKGEYYEGKLNASFSIYRIIEDNVAEAIPDVTIPNTGGTQAFRAAEGVVSKGFELSLQGKIGDNVNIDFGLANFRSEDANGNKISTEHSRTTSNLFTTYKLNDYLLGIGLDYKSRYYSGSGTTQIKQKGYTLAKVMLGYKINKHSKIQLNINNIFDKKYYEGIGSNGMFYGSPRNTTLVLKYKF